MARLIFHHWDSLIFVPKASRFLGMVFGTGRGVMQGNPVSPMIFKSVVDTIVRAVLEIVYEPQEARHGMSWATGEKNLVFYAGDRRISGRDHIWVKVSLMGIVEMLRRVVIDTNLEKTKALVCTPGYIWGKWREEVYKRRATGEGET